MYIQTVHSNGSRDSSIVCGNTLLIKINVLSNDHATYGDKYLEDILFLQWIQIFSFLFG